MKRLKITLLLVFLGLISASFVFAFIDTAFTQTIYDLAQRVFKYLLAISIPFAVAAIIWAAFSFLTSAGEPEKTEKAKKILTYALIGFIIILLSDGIVYALGNFLGVKR